MKHTSSPPEHQGSTAIEESLPGIRQRHRDPALRQGFLAQHQPLLQTVAHRSLLRRIGPAENHLTAAKGRFYRSYRACHGALGRDAYRSRYTTLLNRRRKADGGSPEIALICLAMCG